VAAAAAFLAIVLISPTDVFAHEVHFSPEERLDAIDVELISTAKLSTDFAG
jgi:hypothetical protein